MWVEQIKPPPNTVRTVTKFLFFPKVEYNDETRVLSIRWLETATWKEVYTLNRHGNFWKFKKYIK